MLLGSGKLQKTVENSHFANFCFFRGEALGHADTGRCRVVHTGGTYGAK
jgi:hypothetical protein